VRALRAPHGGQLKEVLPGQPAEIIGLRGMPQAGDALMVGGKSLRHLAVQCHVYWELRLGNSG
jgi:hypothetical protein